MTRADATRYLLGRATDAGVELEVLADETRELTLEAYRGELAHTTQATRGGLGLRVVKAGRVGYASSEEMTREALDWAFAEACDNADLAADEDGFLPAGQALGQRDLLSEGLSAPLERKARLALDLEAGLRADERTQQVPYSRYTERETQRVLASTRGTEGGYRSGMSMVGASLVMREGDSIKQGWDADVSREIHALDPMTTSQRILERTGRLLGARPLGTGRYRAWLEPKVTAALLGLVLDNLSGKTLVEGRSRFAGRLGERIASEHVTLVDDPTLEGGLASRPFDAEGTPARRTPLIDEGVLTSFLHNSATARRAGHANTGHADRSYRGTLGVSGSNVVLEPGETAPRPTDGVIVTGVMGLHAGADPVSGDFSLQGLGLRVEGGEVAHAVENFALSGNLFAVLERVAAVGDDPEWVPSRLGLMRVPSLEIESLSFAGA